MYLNYTWTEFLISSETEPAPSKGPGSLCSSTLEKLKGFVCTAEPSVKHSDSQRQEKEIASDHASSRICEQESSIWPPLDVTDQHSNKNRLQQTEEELKDEEEKDVKDKQSSELVGT